MPWPVKGNIQTFVFKTFALCFELPRVFVWSVLETWWLWNLPIFIQLWKKSNGPFHKVIETFHQLSDFSKFLFVQGSKHLSRYWNNFQAPLTQKRLNIKSSSKWEFLREQKINLFKCQFYEALKTLYTYFWRVLHRNTEIHVVKMIPSNARSHQNVFQESQEIGVRLIISLGSELVGTRLFGRVHLVIQWSSRFGRGGSQKNWKCSSSSFSSVPNSLYSMLRWQGKHILSCF